MIAIFFPGFEGKEKESLGYLFRLNFSLHLMFYKMKLNGLYHKCTFQIQSYSHVYVQKLTDSEKKIQIITIFSIMEKVSHSFPLSFSFLLCYLFQLLATSCPRLSTQKIQNYHTIIFLQSSDFILHCFMTSWIFIFSSHFPFLLFFQSWLFLFYLI